MKSKIKAFVKKVIARLEQARGNKIVEWKLFGLQLFLLAQPDKWHTNIFVLHIPLLRIDTEPTKFGINLLLFTWLYKAVRILLTRWSFVNTECEIGIRFCGINILSRKDIVPFRFPTAMFRG